jgi:RNA polymerase sigma factor (sigma-70 family)
MLNHDSPPDTTGERFPETRHSVVVRARSGDAGARGIATQAIMAAYWKPAYKYIRYKWHVTKEDAEDLTQGFFASTIDAPFFARFDASKAKFRSYLRMCLDGFVANERKAAGRLKRGGGVGHIPLDFETAEGEFRQIEIPEGTDPEQVFRQEWIRSLFEHAVEALRSRCAPLGKEICFRLFERYDLDGAENPRTISYADLAEEFGLPVTQVTNYLAYARREFRAILLQRLRELSGSEEEFHEDVRDILGGGPR